MNVLNIFLNLETSQDFLEGEVAVSLIVKIAGEIWRAWFIAVLSEVLLQLPFPIHASVDQKLAYTASTKHSPSLVSLKSTIGKGGGAINSTRTKMLNSLWISSLGAENSILDLVVYLSWA